MQEKDLFAALSYVDDTYVEEAETYAVRRVIPLHAVRWAAALAACICLLLGWAVAVQWVPFGGFGGFLAKDAAAPENATEGAAEETVQEHALVEEEKAEEEAEVEESSAAVGAQPTETPESEEDSAYIILNDVLEEEDTGKVQQPANGEWVCESGLRNRVMDVLRMQITPGMAAGIGNKDIRFLAAFRLTKDGKQISPDSEEYLLEVQRLVSLGYEFRTLYVEGKSKDIQVCICGLFTAEQLDEFNAREFDALDTYGYVFYFPRNEDGTPLDWNNQAELCGLPTAEDALVTKD